MNKYFTKLRTAIFSTIIFYTASFSQTATITGTVHDKNNLDIAGANVVVLDNNGKVVTGASTTPFGLYTITNVPEGTYKIEARIIGYKEESKNISVVNGETYKVNFVLSSSEVNLNPVVVTASKKAEKLSEAPASIQVLQAKDLVNMAGTTTLADALAGLPGVEIFSQGAFAKSVNTRGYNSIFSGAMLVLTDYRIARVPSLNLNALHFLPQQTDDIEQIELVLGPSAALYGPNSHRGVLHLITKSPFNYQGTSFSLAGGERNYQKLEVKHAQTLGDDFAFKVTASKMSLHDWEVEDYSSEWTTNDFNTGLHDSLKSSAYWKTEPLRRSEILNKTIFLNSAEWKALDTKIKSEGTANLTAYEKALLFKSTHAGLRNYDINKWNFDVRMDYKPIEDMNISTNFAVSEMSHLEMTGIGMGITDKWQYMFGQIRMNYKDFFIQTFLNKSNSGDTYRVDDGFEQTDESEMFVVQGQYTTELMGASLTGGFDYQKITPMTSGTINGNYEGQDNYFIAGGFFQAKYPISNEFDFIFAARGDRHSMIDEIGFSPKAALIYKMDPQNTFRFTASQAYSTPSSLEYFLDLSRGPMSSFPFNYDVRVQGIPKEKGFYWTYDQTTNKPYFYLANRDSKGEYVRFLSSMYNADTWNYIKLIFTIASSSKVPILNVPMPTPADNVEFDLKQLNLTTRGFEPMSNPVDIAPYENTRYRTLEFGYKGILDNRLVLSLDAHYDEQNNLGGPLQMESPFVFINGTTFGKYLLKYKDLIGADSATIMTYANGIGAKAPLGVISADGQFYRNSALVTYRNIKTTIKTWGLEFGSEFLLTEQIRLNGSYSYNSAIKQLNINNNPNLRLYAASPHHKYTIGSNYSNLDLGFDINVKYRYQGSFEVENGSYVGTEEKPYKVNNEKEADNGGVAEQHNIDLDAGYLIIDNLRLSLQVTNLLNKMQRQYIGAPKIGRFSILGIKYTL